MASIISSLLLLLLLLLGTSNACNVFQRTCTCLSQTHGRKTTWAPATTFEVQTGDLSCTGSGGCEINSCEPTHFHSCSSCRHPNTVTRHLETPGYINRWDVWSMFISESEDDHSCFSDLVGTTAFGDKIYSTIIVQPGSSVEISRLFSPQQWKATGGTVLLPETEFLFIHC